ncbi:hypothetical protein [Antarcticirhabdus aurantiaca]|uniref:Uncharacterized protein n=1 Tax=Antarcticirhabdus aurantiaca TaxID=2606717 RepID=A0ACD4NUW0_9HYPH|nr:hypothetical protein [Antarcticirhabdus aurantiaca]WAJ30623.1 hypothetical protein OXU80_10625 [Jeongeuplla avenae]
MPRKPFPWRKLTPAQIAFMERIAAADGAVPFGKLDVAELAAFEELRRLKLVDMRAGPRRRLEAVLTDKGAELRASGYRTDQIVLGITVPQIAALRFLDQAAGDGPTFGELPGPMIDVVRRMMLRGWAEWHGEMEWPQRARLTPAGREVLSVINELDDAVAQMAEARNRGVVH